RPDPGRGPRAPPGPEGGVPRVRSRLATLLARAPRLAPGDLGHPAAAAPDEAVGVLPPPVRHLHRPRGRNHRARATRPRRRLRGLVVGLSAPRLGVPGRGDKEPGVDGLPAGGGAAQGLRDQRRAALRDRRPLSGSHGAGASSGYCYKVSPRMESGAPVQLSRVTMAFGDRPVFAELSSIFPAGKISVVLGGSGSGKSTLLRLIGGLIRPLAGSILINSEDVTRLSERDLFRVRRKLGMLFQQGALL